MIISTTIVRVNLLAKRDRPKTQKKQMMEKALKSLDLANHFCFMPGMSFTIDF